jgi:hypothetical protein
MLGGYPGRRRLSNRENREQAIPDEFQYLTAIAVDDSRLCIKERVKDGDDTAKCPGHVSRSFTFLHRYRWALIGEVGIGNLRHRALENTPV